MWPTSSRPANGPDVGERSARRRRWQDSVLVQRLQRELRRLQLMVENLLELSRLENSLPQESSSYTAITLEVWWTARISIRPGGGAR